MIKLIDVYRQITEKDNIKAGKFRLDSEKINIYGEMINKTKGFNADEGWLCYESAVFRFNNGKLPDRSDMLLSGELVRDKRSLHIRQDGAGWRMTIIDESTGEDCLIKAQTYLISENEKCKYHVHWVKTVSGYQPGSYRFIGFEN